MSVYISVDGRKIRLDADLSAKARRLRREAIERERKEIEDVLRCIVRSGVLEEGSGGRIDGCSRRA